MRSPPAGLKIELTERGFELEVVLGAKPGLAAGLRKLIPMLLFADFFFAIALFVALTERGMQMSTIGVLGAAGVMAALFLVLLLIWARTAHTGTVVLDGEILRFPSTEGSVRLRLSELNGIDVVPIGLAIRPARGMTHHLMLPKLHPRAVQWLESVLEERRASYGSAEDIPEELSRLKSRESESTG